MQEAIHMRVVAIGEKSSIPVDRRDYHTSESAAEVPAANYSEPTPPIGPANISAYAPNSPSVGGATVRVAGHESVSAPQFDIR